MLITFSCEQLLYVNSLGCQVLAFFRGRCQELLKCQKGPSKKSFILFVRASVLPSDYVGIYWRRSLHNKTALLRIIRRKVFCQCPGSAWSSSNELDAVSLNAQSKEWWVATWNQSRHTDWCPRLTPDHRRRRRMFAYRHQKGTISTDFLCYLLISSWSASRIIIGMPEFFFVLSKGKWIVVSKEQIELRGLILDSTPKIAWD